jgi:hypothetical protein
MLKAEDQSTKRQYVHATTNTTTTAKFTTTTPITTHIETRSKTKSIKMKIAKVYHENYNMPSQDQNIICTLLKTKYIKNY